MAWNVLAPKGSTERLGLIFQKILGSFSIPSAVYSHRSLLWYTLTLWANYATKI